MSTDLTVTRDNTHHVLDELEPLLLERSLTLAAQSLATWPGDTLRLTITDPAGVFVDQQTSGRWSTVLKRGRKLGVCITVDHPVTLADVKGDGFLRDLLAGSA